MKKLFLAAIAGLAISGSSALGNETLDFGKSVYKQFCSHCHGLDMVNPGTSSYDLRKWPTDKKDQFYDSVLNGQGDMPAWGDILLENEIDALWVYVATRGGKEPLPEEAAKAVVDTPEPLKTSALVTQDHLTACLARNGGIMSGWRHSGGIGMDYELVRGIAQNMDLPLKVTWYESEAEEDTTPAKDLIALLSYGLCDVAPGFALYEPVLDQYTGTRASIPRWEDRPDTFRRGTQVDLGAITVSHPYMRMEIGLVHRDTVEIGMIDKISDLDGLHLGVEQGTLPGVLTLRQGTTRMNTMASTFNPGPEFLWKMENGAFDAALVTVSAFDFHRRQNSITKLKLHPYRHPLGFNLGVAMLSERKDLVDRINVAIAAMQTNGQLEHFANTAGLHYAAPTQPIVQARLTLQDLIAIK